MHITAIHIMHVIVLTPNIAILDTINAITNINIIEMRANIVNNFVTIHSSRVTIIHLIIVTQHLTFIIAIFTQPILNLLLTNLLLRLQFLRI